MKEEDDASFHEAVYMSKEIKESIIKARILAEKIAQADGWKLHFTSKDVKVETLDFFHQDSSPLPVVRGCSILDFGVEELIRCIRSAGARKIWDPRFDDGDMVRHLGGNNNTFFSKSRGFMGFVSPRYIYGVQHRYYNSSTDTHVILVNSLSLSDKDAPPLPKGFVEADLKLAAWYLKPLNNDDLQNTTATTTTNSLLLPQTNVTYYAWINPMGNLASAIVKMLSTQAGMCVATVRDYLLAYGTPLGATAVGWALIEKFNFDHTTKSYDFVASLSDKVTNDQVKESYIEFNVDPKMYPSGVEITLSDYAQLEDIDCVEVKNGRSEYNKWFKIRFKNEKWRGVFSLGFVKRGTGEFKMTINDKSIEEVDSS